MLQTVGESRTHVGARRIGVLHRETQYLMSLCWLLIQPQIIDRTRQLSRQRDLAGSTTKGPHEFLVSIHATERAIAQGCDD